MSRFEYVGWQVGIAYQTKDRGGLTKEYLADLLPEMKAVGMNFISFMMVSHGMNDSLHDGYTWPVRHPKARCYVDESCTREFLKEIVGRAGDLGLHVNLFMNGFWWNPDKVKRGYHGIRALNDAPAGPCYHHCSDNEDTWSLACDEVRDLLSYYSHPAVKSYGFEMIGQGRCTCPDTMRMFNDALGTAKLESGEDLEHDQELFRLWQAMRGKQALTEYVLALKNIRPSIDIWHHGYMELGDYGGYRVSPDSCKKAGIDVAMPCIHTITEERALKSVLESSEDFPLALHIDTRDKPTKNYSIPLKGPGDIRNMGEWIENNNRENLVGAIFFNEVATSKENKRAVYDVVRNWKERGLF